MDKLLELLKTFGVDVDAETIDYSGLTDDQLQELSTALLALYQDVKDGETVDLEALSKIAEVNEGLIAEDDARQLQAQADAEELAKLDERMGVAPKAEADGDDDPAKTADEPAEDEPAEPAEPAEGDEPAAEPTEAEAVAAAAVPRRLTLTELAAARLKVNEPDPSKAADTPEGGLVTVTAGGDIPGFSTGERITEDRVPLALKARAEDVGGLELREGQRFTIAKYHSDFPEERQLSDADYRLNERKVEAVVAAAREAYLEGEHGTVDALAAAGGRCGPLPAKFDTQTVGTDARPVAGGLPSFTDGRGGVRFMPPPVLSDIVTSGSGGAVGQWTDDQDIAAVNDTGTRKPIQTIVCGTETTVLDYAVTKRLQVGVNLARTNPERLRNMIDLTNVAWARKAEGLLLTRIKALSTAVGEDAQLLGSRRDLLAVWIKAAWALRNRHRMDSNEVLQLIVPDAIVAHSQIDALRQLPGDQRDRLTRDEVIGELRAINVDPIITPDMPAHLAPAQVAGAQQVDLPAPIEWAMFPMGTFAYIDGGEFDLGFEAGTPIRDTTMLAANNFQLFGESWENVAKFGGPESIWGRTMVAPTGEVAGTVDTNVDLAS